MSSAATTDLGLQIPLHGTRLIEASAGTGKTYTLATLYVRLIIEARMTVPQILAVTFTIAATGELRTRLRERLSLALALADESLVASGDGAAASTAALVDAALQQEPRAALVQRLRAAVEAMDLAPIHTIHAFCQRALADHAVEAAQPLIARELLASEKALWLEIATEFWRTVSYANADADVLLQHWRGPQAFASDLQRWLSVERLEPWVDAPTPVAAQRLADATAALRDAATRHGDDALAALQGAYDSGAMNRNKFQPRFFAPRLAALIAWRDGPGDISPPHEKMDWFTPDALRERCKSPDGTGAPTSPLFDVIADWFVADAAHTLERNQRRIALVHRACTWARTRRGQLLTQRAQQGFDDLIRDVDAALRGPNGASFAQRLRHQFRAALVDEFQDTDPRQWSIFRELFATDAPDSERALFLIGDPKQSIYRFRGGDVFTYLAASEHAKEKYDLTRNFRSRPSVLRAVQALFELGGDAAFAQEGIAFTPVAPGGACNDDALRIHGKPAPALTVLRLASAPKGNIDDMRDAAAIACAHEIHTLLQHGRLQHGQPARATRPGDIAVLVRRNEDALRMQAMLSSIGVPSVAPARDSVFASAEAEEWRRLLLAIVAPGDDGRLRAALATPLLGWTAVDLATLDDDTSGARQRDVQDLAHAWRQRLDSHGILALGNDLCAAHAPRLLALVDGERRLTNHLQLLDALQCDPAAALGARALLDALERRMRDADANNEDEQLRLESDADRVRILTLHRSKGLEFDLVFLPFVATDGTPQARGLVTHHDGTQRIGRLVGGGDTQADAEALQAERDEERAESLRLLYVGLTRAKLALWVAWGPGKCAGGSAFAWLLHREPGMLQPMPVEDDTIPARLALLQSAAPNAVVVRDAAELLPTQRLASKPTPPAPPAAVPRRELARDWWIYSYSQLAREDAGNDDTVASDEAPGAGDEHDPLAAADVQRSPFVGSRFGNSLHHALEHVHVARWRDWVPGRWPDDTPPGEHAALVDGLRSQGFADEHDADGVPLLARLVGHTLTVRLPEGTRLCDLPDAARRNELEFHLGLAPIAVPALIDTLHRHGIASARQGFGLRRRIEGLLTGRIDLVYRHDGRYYVLDYKSNLLPDYAPDALALAARDSEYDLQYALYAVALHRWLRFRLGEAYDPARHLGGVRYLYCRGLDATQDTQAGILAPTLPQALLDDLDALFAGRGGVA